MKILRGYQEKTFNYLLDPQADIVRDLKEGTRQDYVVTIWEGVRIENNIAKEGVTLELYGDLILSGDIGRENMIQCVGMRTGY